MSYLVLARKYRPKNFAELVGQSHIGEVLKNAIESNRIAHAYVFSGSRGTGKTTTARILAKALNCEKGPTANPCSKCVNCKSVTEGSSVDVIEIDGASNRGIDEIRALRENVKFTPASLRYKVYIIDEAHQITDAAFNALLKTLEEPPEHVVFIFATTRPEKIPVTILSRCQRFKFRPLSVDEIATHLKKLASQEKFNIDDTALRVIGQAAGGSLRDSLSMLDQIVSFSLDKVITQDTVRELLGLSPHEFVSSLVDLIVNKDSSGVLKKISGIFDEGYDIVQTAKDFREYLSNLVYINYIGDEKNMSQALLPEQVASLKKHKDVFTVNTLLRNLNMLNKAIEEMRFSDNPRLLFELYCLKILQPAVGITQLITQLEHIEKNLSASGGDSSEGQSVEHKAVSQSSVPPEVSNRIEPQINNFSSNSKWETVVREVKNKKFSVGGFLEASQMKEISANEIMIYASGGLCQENIKNNIGIIEEVVKQIFLRDIKIKCGVSEKPVKKQNQDNDEVVDKELVSQEMASSGEVFEVSDKIPKGESKIADKTIQSALDLFNGKIIERHGSS